MVGFNWLLPQCFDLSCFLSKLCVEMHVSMFLVNKLRCGMLVNFYWAIVIAQGITTNIHPVFNFDLPTHWDRNIYNLTDNKIFNLWDNFNLIFAI